MFESSTLPEIDVHVCVSERTPKAWVSRCLESVQAAIARAQSCIVTLHQVPAVEGHLGQARANGYRQGNAPYVTYVDDDDWIEPQAFQRIGETIQQHANADAFFPRERLFQNEKYSSGGQRHLLMVFKREHVVDHARWIHCGDIVQRHYLYKKRCVDIDEVLITYRVYKSKARDLRLKYRHEFEEISHYVC